MEKTLVRVPYNEKRLQFLDATLPFLYLEGGRKVYNFDYWAVPQATFIRELNEHDSPIIPMQLWNFKGEDLTKYVFAIKEIEYDKAVVYEAAKEVYDDMSEDELLEQVEEHYQRVLAMDDGKCQAREDVEGTFEAERAENERRQNLLNSIAQATAGDEDALPTPEVMQLRHDAAQKAVEDAFALSAPSSEIVVETPKIITSLNEPLKPSKLIL